MEVRRIIRWSAFLFTLCALGGVGAPAALASVYPPPPIPPPPPPGLAETFYSTCGGSHPPLQYVRTQLSSGDEGYRELQQYARSPEYRRYLSDLERYKDEYFSENGGYGEVDSGSGNKVPESSTRDARHGSGADARQTRRQRLAERRRTQREQRQNQSEQGPRDTSQYDYAAAQREAQATMEQRRLAAQQAQQGGQDSRTPPSEIPGGPQQFFGYRTGGNLANGANTYTGKMMGNMGGRVNRNPRQDLATWLRGVLYHDHVHAVDYDDGPDAAAHLDKPVAGPGLHTSYYAMLVSELGMPKNVRPPQAHQVFGKMDQLWEKHWKPNLGFDQDPDCRKLLATLENAAGITSEAQKKLEALNTEARKDPSAATRLKRQVEAQAREVSLAKGREGKLRGTWIRRTGFVRAMAELLRFAPEGGFGPALATLKLEPVQAASSKILLEIGPLSAGSLWNGMLKDLKWLEAHPAIDEGGKERKNVSNAARRALTAEIAKRELAVKSASELLLTPKISGYSAACMALIENRSMPKSAIHKGFELIEARVSQGLDPWVVQVAAALSSFAKDPDKKLSEHARATLLKILTAPKAELDPKLVGSSMKALLCDKDGEIATEAQKFMERQGVKASKTNVPVSKASSELEELQVSGNK